MKSEIYRQGDVMVRRVASIPAGARPQPRDGQGRVVLALGESSGHAHQVMVADQLPAADDAVLLTVAESATFLRLAKKAQLVHEEHAAIDLAPGTYEIVHQREWTPWGEKRVLD